MAAVPVTGDFYVYEHWRPDTNRPFYVGKGRGKRSHAIVFRNRHHKNVVAKAGRPIVKFVAKGLSEVCAFALERERIALWHGMAVPLANKTDGGEGLAGREFTPEHRGKISAANTGKTKSPETRAKIAEKARGREVSTSTRAKLSAVQKGRVGKPHTAETRAKLSAIAAKRKLTPEHRANIAAAGMGRKVSQETRAKLSKAGMGRKLSTETREKISATKKSKT